MSHFYFLITYGVCKKRKYYNRMSEKKTLLFLINFFNMNNTCLRTYLNVSLPTWWNIKRNNLQNK